MGVVNVDLDSGIKLSNCYLSYSACGSIYVYAGEENEEGKTMRALQESKLTSELAINPSSSQTPRISITDISIPLLMGGVPSCYEWIPKCILDLDT